MIVGTSRDGRAVRLALPAALVAAGLRELHLIAEQIERLLVRTERAERQAQYVLERELRVVKNFQQDKHCAYREFLFRSSLKAKD